MLFRSHGFTLIELLVVISIISLLSSVVFASVNSARAKARDARRLADLNQIAVALEFYLDNGLKYPGSNTTYYWISDNNYDQGLPCSTTIGLKPWLASVCTLNDPLGYPYAYVIVDDTHYRLGARFELTQNQGIPFIRPPATTLDNYYERK